MSSETVYLFIPEAILAAVAMLVYVGGTFAPRAGRAWSVFGLVAIIAAGAALAQQYSAMFWPAGDDVSPILSAGLFGAAVADLFSQYMRWLVLAVGGLFLLVTSNPARNSQPAEFVGTLIMAVAGLMTAAQAQDLVLLFVGLELVSIPTYVLLYLGRRDVASQESATKYFFLSILSSGLLLYGFSFLYGVAGSTNLVVIRETLAAAPAGGWSLLARVAMLLIFAGLGFRIAAVPFHFYAPDVYQGTTNANAGILSILPKVAGFIGLVRVLAVAMPSVEGFGWCLSLILALLTMTLGNLVALWQNNVRRLLAYSSIAHAGYMLIGLAVAFATAGGATEASGLDGVAATLFYLAVYSLATTGAFALLAYLGGPDGELSQVDDLAGAGRTHPVAGVLMSLFMFSLAGIPPLAGFWGKLMLFGSALGVGEADQSGGRLAQWFMALAVVGVLNAAVAAYYYLRIISVMYFRPPAEKLPAQGGFGAVLAAALCGIAVVGVGLRPAPIMLGAQVASESTRVPASPALPAAEAAVAAADRP